MRIKKREKKMSNESDLNVLLGCAQQDLNRIQEIIRERYPRYISLYVNIAHARRELRHAEDTLNIGRQTK